MTLLEQWCELTIAGTFEKLIAEINVVKELEAKGACFICYAPAQPDLWPLDNQFKVFNLLLCSGCRDAFKQLRETCQGADYPNGDFVTSVIWNNSFESEEIN